MPHSRLRSYAALKLLAATLSACALFLLSGLTEQIGAQQEPPVGKVPGTTPKKGGGGEPKTPQKPAEAAKTPTKKAAETESPNEDLPPPREVKDEEWLTMPPFDRIVLKPQVGGQIFDVELLETRPLPLISTPDNPLKPVVKVYLVGQGDEFELPLQHILQVKHFEDLLLEQAQAAVTKGDMDRGFELIQAVALRTPDWRGLNERMLDLWYREARLLGAELYNAERAVQRFHEVRKFCIESKLPEPDGNADGMGRAVNYLVETAHGRKDYVRARHYLTLLEVDYPAHEITKKWLSTFESEAQAARTEALTKSAAGLPREATYAILRAADEWPNLDGIKDDFDRIFSNYPILPVGVRELPPRLSPWAPPGTPDARVAPLLHVLLMEISAVGENGQFSFPLLRDFRMEEAGRRAVLQLKPNLRWSDGEKPVTAMDLARSITMRCDPRLPSFDAAVASAVSRVSVPSWNEVVVDLKRAQLRPQANFLFNLASGHRFAIYRGNAMEDSETIGAGPFRFLARTAAGEAFYTANPHFVGGKPKIAEVTERRYATGKDAVNALLSGDVALVEQVPIKQLRRLEPRKDLQVIAGSVPAVHVISFDFRSRFEFHNRTLRRAMAYAIDRKRILEQFLLDGPAGERGDLIQGPFPKETFAFDANLETLAYNAYQAKGLADAAKKELSVSGGLRFRLYLPDVEEAREACTMIQAYWKVIGIDVDLQPRPIQEIEEDIAEGRHFELVYRIHHVRDPVLDAARVLCLGRPISSDGAMANCASGWLRQNLRELELATNWGVATEKLQLLQTQARTDIAIIPLWQLTEYHAMHERLSGPTKNPLAFYQGVETWQIAPWFRRDAN